MRHHTPQPLAPTDPQLLLAAVLLAARELLSRSDNDFSWSGWPDQDSALAELDAIIASIHSGELPRPADISYLFAPTGPIQEVSLSSGWADEFLKLSELFDRAERSLGG